MGNGDIHLDLPVFDGPDWASPNYPAWLAWLAALRGIGNVCGLEVGTYEGRSSTWFCEEILTGPGSRLVTLDPYVPAALIPNLRHNIARLHNCEWLPLDLPTYLGLAQVGTRDPHIVDRRPGGFDFVYLDGGKEPATLIENIVLSWGLLKDGGTLICDDYLWSHSPESRATYSASFTFPIKAALDAWMLLNEGRYDLVALGYQACLRKVVS